MEAGSGRSSEAVQSQQSFSQVHGQHCNWDGPSEFPLVGRGLDLCTVLCVCVCVCVCQLLSHVQLFATPQTAAHQAPVHGILQPRTLEWVAISFSKRNYRKKVKSLSRVRLFATPWTVAYQAPPSMEFSRQEYRSGLPFPSPTVLYLYQSVGYSLLQEGHIYDLEQCTSFQ